MDDHGWPAERFEDNRSRLRAVACRMPGSPSEADDAVQEAWLRLCRSDVSDVESLAGWLTTVVSRACLDMLRSRKSRREQPLDADLAEPGAGPVDGVDPERDALLADSVGLALLVILERLAPAERVAFVLHDMFAVSRGTAKSSPLSSPPRAGGTLTRSSRCSDPDVVLRADEAAVSMGATREVRGAPAAADLAILEDSVAP